MSNAGKKSVLLDEDIYAIAQALATMDRRTLKAWLEKMILDKDKRQNKRPR